MMIHELTPKVGRYRNRKRLGRGISAGQGKTAGRGTKGAGSRSGHSTKVAREGGQTPIFRRFPKRGFSNVNFTTRYAVVNIKALDARFEDGAFIDADILAKAGLIPDASMPLKVLGTGETKKKFQITAAAYSKTAGEKITKAGGSAKLVPASVTEEPAKA
ncbi:MAG: 50S ribosomal protein L15 [Phycisphaeraceae bacterium]|nr:50S ribosomal protein L15 [Phycisphaeraceae bacterium]